MKLKAKTVDKVCDYVTEGKVYDAELHDLKNGAGPYAVIKADNGTNLIVEFQERWKHLNAYIDWEVIDVET